MHTDAINYHLVWMKYTLIMPIMHFTVVYISNRFFILMTARVNACGQKMHLELVLATCYQTNSVLLASFT